MLHDTLRLATWPCTATITQQPASREKHRQLPSPSTRVDPGALAPHRHLPGHSCHTSGCKTSKSSPNRCDRNLATSCPLTPLPALSSAGANVPSPLLPGNPVSYSQSPEVSYNPAVSITASA